MIHNIIPIIQKTKGQDLDNDPAPTFTVRFLKGTARKFESLVEHDAPFDSLVEAVLYARCNVARIGRIAA